MSRAHWLTLLLVSMVNSKARAWDPFTIAAGAQAASGIAGGLGLGGGGGLDDLSEAGIALGDLLVELDVDPTADEEAERAVKRLESIKRGVNETLWTKQEVEHLLDFDQLKAKSHADRIKHVRKMVQLTKKIANMFGFAPKAADKANQVQQTQINYLILEELMAARRARFQAYLDDQDQKIQRMAFLEKIQAEEKRRQGELWQIYKSRRRP